MRNLPNHRITRGFLRTEHDASSWRSQAIDLKKVDPEFQSDIRDNYTIKLQRTEQKEDGTSATQEWEIRVVLKEDEIYKSVQTF